MRTITGLPAAQDLNRSTNKDGKIFVRIGPHKTRMIVGRPSPNTTRLRGRTARRPEEKRKAFFFLNDPDRCHARIKKTAPSPRNDRTPFRPSSEGAGPKNSASQPPPGLDPARLSQNRGTEENQYREENRELCRRDCYGSDVVNTLQKDADNHRGLQRTQKKHVFRNVPLSMRREKCSGLRGPFILPDRICFLGTECHIAQNLPERLELVVQEPLHWAKHNGFHSPPRYSFSTLCHIGPGHPPRKRRRAWLRNQVIARKVSK